MKALFVGLGSAGQRHLRNLRALKGESIEIVAWRARGFDRVVTDSLHAEIGDPAARYGCRSMATLDEALAERPDLTFVCNPTSLHVDVALAAVRAGSHVFVEKPLSNAMTGVPALIAEAARHKRIGYVGYQLRFHPAIRRTEELLRLGAVGRVISVRAAVGEYLPGFHAYEDYRGTYAARRDLGGGVVLTLSHEIDYLCHLFGVPKRVFAMGGHLSDLEIDVDDVADLTMDCGTEACPLPVSLHMDFVQRPPVRNCEIVGTEGKIAFDLLRPSLVHFGRKGEEVDRSEWPNFSRNAMFAEQLEHFLACCAGEEIPRSSVSAAAGVLKVALAALRSMETRRIEEVAA